MADVLNFEVAPGHQITGAHDGAVRRAGATLVPAGSGVWRYTCSCGEHTGVDTDTIQAHVDDVTP